MLPNLDVWIDLFCVPSIAICWMTLGIDRLTVIYYPIKYFRYQKLGIRLQLAFIHIVIFLYLGTALFSAIKYDEHKATTHCREFEYFPYGMYVFALGFRLFAALIFVTVIPIIVKRLKQHTAAKVASFGNNPKLTVFLKRQNIFTNGLLFCCAYTSVLYVVPNLLAILLSAMWYSSIERVSTYTTFLNYLNALPVAYVAFSTQPEICRECFKMMPFLAKIPVLKNVHHEDRTCAVSARS
ncbi:unnamed protein product [Enterobius vermicularis]|uniref:G_PROTEIN_RECEP_F1_2 domain-containing protein n=1 Tax=Enterobius vermicularis TaxID=51028 RepID=A0A0N4VGF3_ENTVE|nr:unnamed protein product [Enterobius vermicularis]